MYSIFFCEICKIPNNVNNTGSRFSSSVTVPPRTSGFFVGGISGWTEPPKAARATAIARGPSSAALGRLCRRLGEVRQVQARGYGHVMLSCVSNRNRAYYVVVAAGGGGAVWGVLLLYHATFLVINRCNFRASSLRTPAAETSSTIGRQHYWTTGGHAKTKP